jgi:hypothetical protein
MPLKFNPFSGYFDFTGSGGGGGGSSYLEGEVQNFSALPTSTPPAVDAAYLVREAEGAWLLNRKPAGIYIRVATTGTRATDWTYAGEFPDVFNDANLVIYNDTDSTKNVKFDVSAVATGTTRTASFPDKNITLDDTSDSRTPTTHAASHAAAGSDPIAPSDIGLGSTDSVAFASVGTNFLGGDYGSIDFSANAEFQDENGGKVFDWSDTVVNFEKPLDFTGPDAATNAATTRTNLGLGNSSTLDTGTTAGTVAAGDDSRFSDIPDPSSATPQALGTAAAGTSDDYSRADHVHGAPALDDLSNVSAAAPNDNDVLTYDTATSTWVAEAPAAGGVSGVAASAGDVLGVSGSDITGVDAGADRLVFWDDSAGELTYLEAGSGLSISGTTITATASGGSKTYAVFTAEHNQPPASAYATLDTRNSVACLDFDDATDESAVFVGIIPEGASLGSGLKIRLHWAATTATSGDVRWDVSLERMTTDLDSDSFDTVASATATTNGTSGILTVTEIALTTIDSVTAGDGFRLKVTRDANNGADTMSGDCELYICEVRSAA